MSLLCSCAQGPEHVLCEHTEDAESEDDAEAEPGAAPLPALPETYVPRELDGREGLYFHEGSSSARRMVASLEGVQQWSTWYQAPWWLRQGDAMTMYQSLYRSADPVEYRRHEVKMLDGGVVALDVLRRANGVSAPLPKASSAVAILIHGLGSDSQEPYVVNMASALAQRGLAVAALNLRGSGNCQLKTPRYISFGRGTTDDLRVVVRYVREKILDGGLLGEMVKIVLVGWSIGGAIVTNTLVEQTTKVGEGHAGRLSEVEAGVALGMPQDAALAVANVEGMLFKRMAYGAHLAQDILDTLAESEELFRKGPVTRWPDHRRPAGVIFDEVLRARSIRELDAALTCKVFGYDSVEEYYEDSSPCRKLRHIKVPLLLANSADDPLASGWVPTEEVRSNPNLILAYTKHGGHNGWRDASDPSRSRWVEKVVSDFAQTAIGNSRGVSYGRAVRRAVHVKGCAVLGA